jgi:hypothetical protein
LDPDPDEQPGSYFRELKKQFFGLKLKILPFFDGSGMEVGSGITIPDPQHCVTYIMLSGYMLCQLWEAL